MKNNLLIPVIKFCRILFPGLNFDPPILTPGSAFSYTLFITARTFFNNKWPRSYPPFWFAASEIRNPPGINSFHASNPII